MTSAPGGVGLHECRGGTACSHLLAAGEGILQHGRRCEALPFIRGEDMRL